MEGTGMPRIPADRDLPPGRKLQLKEHLMEEIRTAPRRRRRTRWVAAGLLVPAALVATLGAAKIIDGRAGDTTQTRCYTEASFHGPVTVEDVRGDQTPLEACASLWHEGMTPGYERSAPRLVACTGGGGDKLAWVFPLPEPKGCGDLGLEALRDGEGTPVPARAADPVPPGQAEGAAAARALDAAVERRVGERLRQGCVPLADVEPVVRDELRRQGLDDWKLEIDPGLRKPITATGEDPGEVAGRELELKVVGPCAGLGIDPEAKLVRLDADYVGIPEGEPVP
jgi:hypothetical protein